MNVPLPWTIHLNGVLLLLRNRKPLFDFNPIESGVIEAIGFLDLPTHTIGRRTPSPCIWHNYCRFKNGIEVVSGLPYNLLDLLSAIEDSDIEARLWSWSYEASNSALQQMWDATRLAAIIHARERCRRIQQTADPALSSGLISSTVSYPSTDVLVHRILTILEDILKVLWDERYNSVWSMILFVLFIAASNGQYLTDSDKMFVDKTWIEAFACDDGPLVSYYRVPLEIVHHIWANNDGKTANQLARARGLEVPLF